MSELLKELEAASIDGEFLTCVISKELVCEAWNEIVDRNQEVDDLKRRVNELEDTAVVLHTRLGKQGTNIKTYMERNTMLDRDIAFLQSCVRSGETAKPEDRPSYRARHNKVGT
jgi:predicted  nucleic acid-binding Zn-ribbon protein